MAKGFVTQGCVAEIGIVNGADRGMIVLPMINMSTPLDPINLCSSCALGLIDDAFPLLTACMGEDSYIGMIHVRGMIPGRLPYNNFYPADTHPGLVSSDSASNQVSANVNFYADPSDYSIGNTLRTAKNFVFGIPESLLTNSIVQSALAASLQAFADKLIEGCTSIGLGEWKRVMRTVKLIDHHADTDDEIPLAILATVVEKVKTQMRRLKPNW